MTADRTLLQMKYADVIRALAQMTGTTLETALRRFYESKEYGLVSKGVSDLHCRAAEYIAEDIVREMDEQA